MPPPQANSARPATKPALKGDCPIHGVSGIFNQTVSLPGMRSAKVIAKAFSAGFQRIVHRFWPVPGRVQ